MRVRRDQLPIAPLVVALALAAVLLAGCHDSTARPASGAPVGSATPTLGGTPPRTARPPDAPMNHLEKPVADRLAAQIARMGLTLEYLDCPHWDGTVPTLLTCKGYVDGIVTDVLVRLEAAVRGKAVSFDARLGEGVIATSRLERTLHRSGWPGADCGDVPAYPAEVGRRVVCRVWRGSEQRFVVATVSDRSGAVMISDLSGDGTSR